MALQTVYDGLHYIRRLWGIIMPQEYGDDRLIFRLASEDALELDHLGEGFAGLARHFRRHLRDEGLDPDRVPSKLYVTQLRTGSIEFELGTAAALYLYAQSAADGFVIWRDFYDRVRQTLEWLAGRGSKPQKYSLEDAHDYDAFLRTIAGKKGAALNVRRARFQQKTGKREVLAEFDFDERDVASAHARLAPDSFEMTVLAAAERAVLPLTHHIERSVPFIWFRADRDKGKVSGQTSDRGIIAKISDKALPVFFASEIENQKDKMIRTERNPFSLVYIVDVGVAFEEPEKPKSYTILHIHRIVGADSEAHPGFIPPQAEPSGNQPQ